MIRCSTSFHIIIINCNVWLKDLIIFRIHSDLCNSVSTADRKLDKLSERINHKIDGSCNSFVSDNDLHCHIVSKNDFSMAVKKLKSDKLDVEGRVLSNNYIHDCNH